MLSHRISVQDWHNYDRLPDLSQLLDCEDSDCGFVQLQAQRWGTKYASNSKSLRFKINEIHLEAFARPATQGELAWGEEALKDIGNLKKLKMNSPELWQEFCHIIINRKEFIYLF